MKTKTAKIIIPIVLLLGGLIVFLVASGLQVNASTGEALETTNALTMYLYVEGIPGESVQQDHAQWIDVLAYSHNIQASYDMGTARTSGSAQHTPLRITKMVDKATPKLYEACAKGTAIPSVQLDFCRADVTQNVFYSIQLQNAHVTSVQEYGLLEDIPTETVSFVYETIKWVYTEYDSQGNAKGNVEFIDSWQEETPA
ncbi:MAG: type VI secretion system tube protein Hcp [Candidatus Heimdallarchaeota archaeon]|nr:MAG: type VI secretion system tube protein Hcp [Candidatus Heimdallarchaeota archaeon]